ncbi:MAG: hypothetical protein HY698_10745 [Deltaproteobacteria bacterium]|nr:hypothetical protein [Deltaproteobacteria bacterium]
MSRDVLSTAQRIGAAKRALAGWLGVAAVLCALAPVALAWSPLPRVQFYSVLEDSSGNYSALRAMDRKTPVGEDRHAMATVLATASALTMLIWITWQAAEIDMLYRRQPRKVTGNVMLRIGISSVVGVGFLVYYLLVRATQAKGLDGRSYLVLGEGGQHALLGAFVVTFAALTAALAWSAVLRNSGKAGPTAELPTP